MAACPPTSPATALRGAQCERPKAKPQSLPRQRDILQKLIEADLVDCVVALPGHLFYSTQITVCLWFLAENKSVEFEGPARLFDGEIELSLVAYSHANRGHRSPQKSSEGTSIVPRDCVCG